MQRRDTQTCCRSREQPRRGGPKKTTGGRRRKLGAKSVGSATALAHGKSTSNSGIGLNNPEIALKGGHITMKQLQTMVDEQVEEAIKFLRTELVAVLASSRTQETQISDLMEMQPSTASTQSSAASTQASIETSLQASDTWLTELEASVVALQISSKALAVQMATLQASQSTLQASQNNLRASQNNLRASQSDLRASQSNLAARMGFLEESFFGFVTEVLETRTIKMGTSQSDLTGHY